MKNDRNTSRIDRKRRLRKDRGMYNRKRGRGEKSKGSEKEIESRSRREEA